VGAVIRGIVTGPDGRALSGARVYVRRGPGPLPDVAGLTSEAGDFALAAPYAGEYVIESAADGFEPGSATVVVDEIAGDVRADIRLGYAIGPT
jgi:hypothetical protein